MARSRWWYLGQFFRPGAEHAPEDPYREEGEQSEDPRWSALWALIMSGVLSVGVLAAAVWLLLKLAKQSGTGPEAALSLVFVATAVVLILVVCTLTIVFKRLWLSDRSAAMGLPPGSVRSIIALLLIMLFFISAIFLFNSTKNEPAKGRTLEDLSIEQFQEIPADQIRSSSSHVVGGTPLYDVTLLPDSGNTPTSDDIAKQLVTTVATLVTAVAAFYFGANSVSSAHREAARGGGPGRRRRRRSGPRRPRPDGGRPGRRGAAKSAEVAKAAATKAAVTEAAASKATAKKTAAKKAATAPVKGATPANQAAPAKKAAPRAAAKRTPPAKKGPAPRAG